VILSIHIVIPAITPIALDGVYIVLITDVLLSPHAPHMLSIDPI